MTTSRRDFMTKCTLATLTASLPLQLAGNVIGQELKKAEIGLTKEAFKSSLNSRFVIYSQKTTVNTTLVSVSDLTPRPRRSAHREGYSLVFHARQGQLLKQGTYQLKHEKLGSFSLFIVPVNARKGEAQHYEAVINRLYS